MNFWKKLTSTFDTNAKDGFSARKSTAFVVMLLIIVGHILFYRYATKHDKWELWIEVLFLDYSMIAACLGMVVWENIRTKKNEQQEQK